MTSLRIQQRPSPNFNARSPTIALEYIVLHYTGMRNGAEALTRLCHPKAEVSAHYVICEEGNIYQLVDEKMRAWHAGKSFWRGLTDLNSASIGIELVNPGHEFGYRPFPDAQITMLKSLVADIAERNKMVGPTCLLAHSDIAATRRQDPGELFPWQEFAKLGYGLWPLTEPHDFTAGGLMEATDLLNVLGYEIGDLPETLRAFQRHYLPDHLTGMADAETLARLRALNRMLSVQEPKALNPLKVDQSATIGRETA